MKGANLDAMSPKLTNQLCSMLGGGCAAPLSESQIAQGAARLTPTQADAVKENLGTSLGALNVAPAVAGSISKAVAPKLPGILGALL
jgi:hypothetical protein